MNKYIEAFCQQNPNMKLPCGNPKCKKVHTFTSKEVLKTKSYDFTCKYCGRTTTIDTTKFTEDFLKQMKALGITVK